MFTRRTPLMGTRRFWIDNPHGTRSDRSNPTWAHGLGSIVYTLMVDDQDYLVASIHPHGVRSTLPLILLGIFIAYTQKGIYNVQCAYHDAWHTRTHDNQMHIQYQP